MEENTEGGRRAADVTSCKLCGHSPCLPDLIEMGWVNETRITVDRWDRDFCSMRCQQQWLSVQK